MREIRRFEDLGARLFHLKITISKSNKHLIMIINHNQMHSNQQAQSNTFNYKHNQTHSTINHQSQTNLINLINTQ